MGQYYLLFTFDYLLLLRTQTQTQTRFMLHEIKAFCSHLSFLDLSLYNSEDLLRDFSHKFGRLTETPLILFICLFSSFIYFSSETMYHIIYYERRQHVQIVEGVWVYKYRFTEIILYVILFSFYFFYFPLFVH